MIHTKTTVEFKTPKGKTWRVEYISKDGESDYFVKVYQNDELYTVFRSTPSVDCKNPSKSHARQVITEARKQKEKLSSSIPVDRWGVHETHCCVQHGCKYGDKDCPVILGLIVQRYSCEDCELFL